MADERTLGGSCYSVTLITPEPLPAQNEPTSLGAKVALDWSIQAMQRATNRLNQTSNLSQAFAAIGESVWWITIVNDTVKDSNFAVLRLGSPNRVGSHR